MASAQGMKLVVYPVKDLEKAKALFRNLLGVKPYADAPYYVGFRVGEAEVGLDPNGHKQGHTGPLPYFYVSDIRASLKSLVDSGAQVQQDIKDVGGGMLVASARDMDGNLIGLRQMT